MTRGLDEAGAALERGDHAEVLRLTDAILAETPGTMRPTSTAPAPSWRSAASTRRKRHAQDAVRLDPEEIRYRELLAEILSREGAHRDAAAEFGRLARNDPRETTWTVAEARERLGAAQPGMGVEAARRAVQLDPRDGRAQLALAQGLTRTGDARGAFQAASLAAELLPGDPEAREALADAQWLAGQEAAAFEEFRALASDLAWQRPRPRGDARRARCTGVRPGSWVGSSRGSVRSSSSRSATAGSGSADEGRPAPAPSGGRAGCGDAQPRGRRDRAGRGSHEGHRGGAGGPRRRCRDRPGGPGHADARRRDGAGVPPGTCPAPDPHRAATRSPSRRRLSRPGRRPVAAHRGAPRSARPPASASAHGDGAPIRITQRRARRLHSSGR